MELESITCEQCGRVWPKPRFSFTCICGSTDEPAIDLSCIHRGQSAGIANCGCAGKTSVHWCALQQGHCTVHATGKTWRTTVEGIDRIGNLKPCVLCDKRNANLVRLFQPTILQDLPAPRSTRALITIAPDEVTQAELRFTRTPMQAYAKRYGLDYIEISALSEQRHKCGAKYAYAEVAARYDQSLWLDPDVVIMPNAPSVFDAVPIDSWGLVDDLISMQSTEWFRQEWDDQQVAWQLPDVELPHAWNSGVVVAPRDAARSYFPPPMPVPDVWCAEQHWHTRQLLLNEEAVVNLDIRWNNGYPWEHWTDLLDSCYFAHLNGCKPHERRLQFLEHLSHGHRSIDNLLDPIEPSWRPYWQQSSADDWLL